ncbi:MAG: hypothetical protein JRJ76_11555 [Deltaproteobacteria bacterium]|nr:hypothetical protein [Deltaproteobacteria bacterium]
MGFPFAWLQATLSKLRPDKTEGQDRRDKHPPSPLATEGQEADRKYVLLVFLKKTRQVSSNIKFRWCLQVAVESKVLVKLKEC